MADSPRQDADYPVELSILSDGSTIDDTIEVLEVRVRLELDRIPEAVIVMADGDPATQDFPVADADVFKPGAEITINAGYGSGTQRAIFAGIVTAQRLRLGPGQPRLEVTCRDKAITLSRTRTSAVYSDMTDADIITQLATAAGLTATVSGSSGVSWSSLVQAQVSDWDFIRMRAEAAGLVIALFDGALTAAAPGAATNGDLEVTYGDDILGLDLQMDATGQYGSFEASAWGPADQAMVSQSAEAASTTQMGNLSAAALAGLLDDAVQDGASAAKLESDALLSAASAVGAATALAAMRGQVRFQGSSAIRPGGTLELSGLGERFSGLAYVCGVVHRIDQGNWVTDAAIGLPEPARASGAGDRVVAAPDLTAAIWGLQVGKVVHIADDPDTEYRIAVYLPALSGEDELWARLASPYASDQAGLLFLPEIGDEVLVGFLSGAPAHPVILGSLWSSGRGPPGDTPDDDNNDKRIQTRTGLTISFDEENKAVSVTTPGGNSVALDDAAQAITLTDQSNNSVTLGTGGIALSSASDLSVEATGSITMTAGTDLTLSGMNISADASVGLTGSGGTSLDLSGGGTASLAAPLVKIN